MNRILICCLLAMTQLGHLHGSTRFSPPGKIRAPQASVKESFDSETAKSVDSKTAKKDKSNSLRKKLLPPRGSVSEPADSETAKKDKSNSLGNKLAGAGVALIGAYVASRIALAAANLAVIPPIDDTTGNRVEENRFFSPEASETGVKIRAWRSAATGREKAEKALLFLPGNGWGFEGAIDFAEYLSRKFAREKISIRVYTIAYLGQGSTTDSFSRNERRHVQVVKDTLRSIIRDGYETTNISIFSHSIGGLLSGLALVDDEFDGVGALAIASPSHIGAVVAELVQLPHAAIPVLGFVTQWRNNAIDGYKKRQAGPRAALYAEDDNLIHYAATIAAGLSGTQQGRIAGGHNDCIVWDNPIFFDNEEGCTIWKKLVATIQDQRS